MIETKGYSVQVKSQVMVDYESYFRYDPPFARVGTHMPDNSKECSCSHCLSNDGLRQKYRNRYDELKSQEGEWDPEQYLLCPPRVLGYILRDKQWAQLLATQLDDIPDKDESNSWNDRLKLPDGEKTKTMILDLVKGYGTASASSDGLVVDDIVADKGKGLVILLYGWMLFVKTRTGRH